VAWIGDHAGVTSQEPVSRYPTGVLAAVTEFLESFHGPVQPFGLHAHADDLVADPVDQRRAHDRADDETRSRIVTDEVDQQPPDLRVPDHVEHFEIDDEMA